MPHSPELDLTMTIENDGYDAITTQGGAHLSNVKYTGAPMWERVDGTKVPPWTIGEPTTPGRRTGRRVWNLQFNYLSDSDLFASNYMSNTYADLDSLASYNDEDKDILNLGADVLDNGDFEDDSVPSTWTGSAEANLGGWISGGTHNSNNKFTISGGQCTLISDGTLVNISQTPLTIGITYQITVNIKTVSSGQINFRVGSNNQYYDTTGIKTFTATANSSYFEIKRAGACNITFDDVVVRPVNQSDFYYTLDNDDSFHAQVLNKIGNGQRFIFQPDNTNNNPDQFAICQLDQDSLKIKQVANGLYNIKLKIREVW